jgi:hypothetical protein
MLEMVSRASTVARLKEARLIPSNWSDPAAALARKKPAAKHGGRKRLPSEKQRFYLVGRTIDEQFRNFAPAFKLLRTLRATDGNGDSLRIELTKRHLTPLEIDALLLCSNSDGRREAVRRTKSGKRETAQWPQLRNDKQLLFKIFKGTESLNLPRL